jgi:hypothetical protein
MAVLRGIQGIATYTQETYRQAQWRVEKGYYPTRRVGKIRETTTEEIDRVRQKDGAPLAQAAESE